MVMEEKEGNLRLSSFIIEKHLFYSIQKRLLDVISSFTGILILLPLFLIIAISVKINDPKGTVFFSQERMGKNQKIFKMYKFRSMYGNAEDRLEELLKFNEVEGAMFKMKEDPRVTKIGKILRSTSMDELPQLINVLKGDMSLVGPRPPLIREVKQYSTYDKQRLMVKPGITGLWQTSGRNLLTFNEMVELDLHYISRPSILTDIKIILKTVGVVLKKENAY